MNKSTLEIQNLWYMIAALCCGLFFAILVVIGSLENPEMSGYLISVNGVSTFFAITGAIYSLRKEVFSYRRMSSIVPSIEYGWTLGPTITIGVFLLVALTLFALLVVVIVLTSYSVTVVDNEIHVSDDLAVMEAVAAPIFLIILIGGYYFVGHWIGYRSRDYVALTVLLVVILYLCLCFVINLATYGFTQYLATLTETNEFFLFILVLASFLVLIGLLGAWQGRRNRPVYYLRHILLKLPPDTREVVVELAYSETVRNKQI